MRLCVIKRFLKNIETKVEGNKTFDEVKVNHNDSKIMG